MQARAELTEAFGTRKAKKRLAEETRNAVTPQKNADGTPRKLDAASRAILAEIGEKTATMATREELQAATDAAKPVPRPNLDTDDIHDVYDPHVLIGEELLDSVPVMDWWDAVKNKEDLQFPSRFVAARMTRLASTKGATMRLRLLRYILFLIIFYTTTKSGRERGTRQAAPREVLRKLLDPAPDSVIDSIRRRFSDAGTMRGFHIDLLQTHICAFALVVDSFRVELWDLQLDLKLDEKHMIGYFRQIGARVKKIEEKGRTTQVAELSLPLDLPKQRNFRAGRR